MGHSACKDVACNALRLHSAASRVPHQPETWPEWENAPLDSPFAAALKIAFHRSVVAPMGRWVLCVVWMWSVARRADPDFDWPRALVMTRRPLALLYEA